MDHLLDRPLGQEERLGDRRVVLSLGHLAQHVALARRQLVERRLLAARVLRHQRLDDLRVDHRAALCDRADRGDELPEILDALLQEVGAPRAAALQQREHVARVRVLAEHDDADLRIRLAQPLGGLDPLVGVARRHADVGDDDVRPLRVDRGEQRVEVAADGHDLEVGLASRADAGRLRGRGSDPRRARAGSASGRGYGGDVPVSRPARPDRRRQREEPEARTGRAARGRVPDARGGERRARGSRSRASICRT